MAPFELRTPQDILDFTTGCCFFGTGGGGDPKVGFKWLLEALKAGKTIRIAEESSLQEEDMTICPFLMGSSGPDTPALQEARTFYGLTTKTVPNMATAAAKILLAEAEATLNAVVPIEIGGAATASALATAAWLDVPAVDGDYAGGRSMPAISNLLPAIHGLKYCPLVSVDAYDNQVCILQATNVHMEERLGKLVASGAFSLAGQAGLLLPYKNVQPSITKGTLSRAFHAGKALREAKEKGQDATKCIMEITDAHLILKGKLIEMQSAETENYYVGEHLIAGEEEFASVQVKIWFKNEYLQLWWNDQPYVTSPDLICVLNTSTGLPITNSEMKLGDRLTIFAIPAPPQLVTKEALNFLSPKAFGFDFDYAPFITKNLAKWIKF